MSKCERQSNWLEAAPKRQWSKLGDLLSSSPLVTCISLLLIGFFLSACSQGVPQAAERDPVQVHLEADGESREMTTNASTVRELLDEAGLELNESDEVEPPLFTPLENGMTVTVVRVTESIETIPQSIPFERKIVRNESMNADDPPIIVQGGKPGLKEVTVRIVYRDGLESQRQETVSTVIEPAQDEIVMVGIGATRDNITFDGTLAYISDGAAVIMWGTTAFPEQMNTGGPLDGRVFSLSPTGSHLLYTRTTTDTTSFNNSLWVISTTRGAEPRPLHIENVLWADWNPAQTDPLQIAYTTARSTDLPPGWEANNDLWLGDIPADEETSFESIQLVESYPATYGWWGGNHAWSPSGRYIAYSYADEVGIVDTEPETLEDLRIPLRRFTEYSTLADWVWVPTLSWSPDGRFLAFTQHGSDDPEAMMFDSWVVDVATGVAGRFVDQAGMWGHLHWAPVRSSVANVSANGSPIAFLRATNPLDSLRSNYTLWLMDQDGSNARRIYPPVGENSYFPRDQQFMAWGPNGRYIAFIFNDALYLLDLGNQQAYRITQDDAISSHPTWSAGNPASPALSPPTPAAENTPTPAADDSTPTPAAGSNMPTPTASGNTPTPVVNDNAPTPSPFPINGALPEE